MSGTEKDFLLGSLRVCGALLAHWGQELGGGGVGLLHPATDSPLTILDAQTHTC